MTFTDDDLKRLKEWGDRCNCTPETDLTCGQLGHLKTKALLARLEAAEAVIEGTWNGCDHDRICDCPPGWSPIPQKKLEAWRKAAGK